MYTLNLIESNHRNGPVGHKNYCESSHIIMNTQEMNSCIVMQFANFKSTCLLIDSFSFLIYVKFDSFLIYVGLDSFQIYFELNSFLIYVK